MIPDPKSVPNLNFAAFIGLDWADQKHDLVLIPAGSTRPEPHQLCHSPQAIDDWACALRDRFGGQPIAICFEQTRGPIAYALLKYDFFVLFPLPPAKLTSYRHSFCSSGAKDDPTDAVLILDYLLKHRDQLRPWKSDSPETREIRLLAEARRDAVDQRTRCTNQLTAVLKLYFSQALTLVGGDLHGLLACDFLDNWPTLADAQAVAPDALRKFYHAHSCRSEKAILERLDLLSKARPLTNDPAVINAGILQVRCYVSQLRALHKSILEFEHRIKQLMDEHPDAPLFQTLPGAGEALAPRLLAAFGTDRERFASASDLQAFAGVAPVTKRSGKRCSVQRRWACPTFLLQTFHEFAHWSRLRSSWAAAYYKQQRQAGKGHHAALRSLAFKWIRVIFRCWITRTPYSEQIYIRSLAARKAPLLGFLKTDPLASG